MDKVLCFGEILLRFSPDLHGEWLSRQSMPVYPGGAELNVATALAKWGVPVSYCSAVPDNYMSAAMRSYLDSIGVGTDRLVTSGNRIGIYYLAQGTDLKNSEVIYDRAGSSTATLQPGQIDWDEKLDGVSWFHFSAISPAINDHLATVCKEALQAAKRRNITISVDLNYRAKLWKWGKQPKEVMPELVSFCDVVMGNIWAAELMLDIPLKIKGKVGKQDYIAQALATSEAVISKYSSCTQVANTFRFDKGEELQYYGTYFTGSKLFVSKEHSAAGIADKVGSGDCFMAGLIYGDVNQLEPQHTIDFAAAAAVDKMYIVGDATTSGTEQIRKRI